MILGIALTIALAVITERTWVNLIKISDSRRNQNGRYNDVRQSEMRQQKELL